MFNKTLWSIATCLLLGASSVSAKDLSSKPATAQKTPWFNWGCSSEGSSHLKLIWDIDAKGKTFNIRVDPETTTTGPLLQASIAAIQRWRYKPALESGTAVATHDWQTTYEFRCNGEDVARSQEEDQRKQLQSRYIALTAGFMATCRGEGLLCLAQADSYAKNSLYGPPAQSSSTGSDPVLAPGKLMLLGGADNKTYLGCLNCSETDTESILNQFGKFGSEFSPLSIRNQFSNFGSPFSTVSVCNEFTVNAPVIVDQSGAFYGRLTINAMDPNRTRTPAFQNFVVSVCSKH